MAIRRFREHVSEHNWFAVGIDLAIVVVGVFLGLQANNWNQRRLDAAAGRDYRAMLLDDLRDNQQNVASRIDYYQRVRSASLAALESFDRPADQLGERFLIDAYEASQIIPWALKRTTYDQIMSVGAMGDLGDQALQDRIANYYFGGEIAGSLQSTATAYRERARRIIPYRIQERIRTACPETLFLDARGATRPELTKDCRLNLPAAVVRTAVQQVHKEPGLKDDLTRSIVDIDLKLTSLNRIRTRATVLQRALEGHGS